MTPKQSKDVDSSQDDKLISTLNAVLDNYSIHAARGYPKGTIARRALKKRVAKAVRKHTQGNDLADECRNAKNSAANPPTPSSLREQIIACFYDPEAEDDTVPMDVAVDKLTKLVTTYIDYQHRVADNVRLVANWTEPTSWLDPQTGAKVYNQAYIEAAEIEARFDEIDSAVKMTQQMWHTKSPFTNIENIDANTVASTSQYLLTRKVALQAQKAVLEEKS